MEIIKLDLEDGLGLIEVCVTGQHWEAGRIREYFKTAKQAFAESDEHYQRGYDDAIKFIAEGEAA